MFYQSIQNHITKELLPESNLLPLMKLQILSLLKKFDKK